MSVREISAVCSSLAEFMAWIHWESSKPDGELGWVDLPRENKASLMMSMGVTLEAVGLLGLHVKLEGGAIKASLKRELAPPVVVSRLVEEPLRNEVIHKEATRVEAIKEAKLGGYEGESCGECGAMKMVRNGSCLKCTVCGHTNGCS